MINGFIEKGYEPTPSDYEEIRKYTRKEFAPEELYVFEAILCSNDIDRDFEKFSISALNELAELFIGKTGIKDHSMRAADQTARVFQTRVEKIAGRKTADGEDYFVLKAKAYMVKTEENKSFITELDAGIKKEVSVSCAVSDSVCSICGANRKKAHCGHISGREYDGRKCFYVLSGVTDAYEFSFVAVPAQRDAGVEKAFELKKGDFDMNGILKSLEAGGSITLSAEQAASLSKSICEMSGEAELGREYRKALSAELVMLCKKALPEIDFETLKSVASVMTAKELIAFKKAFEKRNAEKSKPQPQLQKAAQGSVKSNLNGFKI